MKKSLIAVAGLAVLSTPVFASKARLTALGQNTNGSFYISDQRSTFANPAYYANYNNFVIMEWGDDGGATAAGTTATTANNLGEGGFARQAGNFVYGVYIGDDDADARNTNATSNGLTSNSTGEQFLRDNNKVTLSFAGDAGIKWGASLWYSSQSKEIAQQSDATKSKEIDGGTMGLRGGVLADNFEAYLEVDFKDEATGRYNTSTAEADTDSHKDKYEGDTGLTLGGNYVFGSWTFFGQYMMSGYEVSDAGTTGSGVTKTGTNETTQIVLGAGNERKLSDKATFWWDVTWQNDSAKNKAYSSTAESKELETKGWDLNLTLAMEAQAWSWLKLRGSVKQAVYATDTAETVSGTTVVERETKGDGSTAVAAGFTMHWSKLMLDATVTHAADGTFRLDQVGSNVAVHYWF